MKVDRFIKWLRCGGACGRTMGQYVDEFGANPIRPMIERAAKCGHTIKTKRRLHGESCNHHRLVLVENDAD